MKKVTGIGGIFFKSRDPKSQREWYSKHLGVPAQEWGATFEWREADSENKGQTVWNPFKQDTKYFEPSQKEFMINYRVENLVALLEELKKAGIEMVGELQDSEFGKFAHIMDPEGNKIELWEEKA
ncbi:MAG TPA: VOC family protein [Bacteroidia bacterium]|jgi:lactoylglutathione lyase|nr:VOC family protein [Bacteroidia bacterium]